MSTMQTDNGSTFAAGMRIPAALFPRIAANPFEAFALVGLAPESGEVEFEEADGDAAGLLDGAEATDEDDSVFEPLAPDVLALSDPPPHPLRTRGIAINVAVARTRAGEAKPGIG